MKKTLLLVAMVLMASVTWAQKAITLEDLWAKGTFSAKGAGSINWLKAGGQYTIAEPNESRSGMIIKSKDIKIGNDLAVIYDDATALWPKGAAERWSNYSLSADEKNILLTTDIQGIYRYSFTAKHYLYNRDTKKVTAVSENGPQGNVELSPNNKYAGFTRANNLFYSDLASGKEVQVTQDGKTNEIINGSGDWVYEEEFETVKAWKWNTDGTKIAWIRFEESKVPTYQMQEWGELYPTNYTYKYPKAGEKNAVVSVWVYDVATQKSTQLPTGNDPELYIPRIDWRDANSLVVRSMNRLQNKLVLTQYDVATSNAKVIFEEKSDTYVDISVDFLSFLPGNQGFITTSEKDGHRHLYQVDIAGKAKQLTKGEWEITAVYGYDVVNQRIYFQTTQLGAINRSIAAFDLKKGKLLPLSMDPGVHAANFSGDYSVWIDQFSTINTVPKAVLRDATGKEIRVMEANAALEGKLKDYNISKVEFFTFTAPQGHTLNGYMIKPAKMEVGKKYPVVQHFYGGPGRQVAQNAFGRTDMLWHQMLANEYGVIVVVVDNRGTEGRGVAFKKATYGQLGKLELEDQIATAIYMATLPFVDKDRMAVWGWSFGGYLTSLCMTKGNGLWAAGIAVAPVITWRYYDSIYTERYLKTPQENADGYDQNSPITFAANLKGKYLLVHGTGDDNVHLQNAIAMEDALIKANIQFESAHYPNKNHGIYGGLTRLHLYTKMTNFFKENLKLK